MNEDGYLRKFGADKITLLSLFIIALFSAYLIVNSKSSIILSEPIELEHTGLSVSIPQGNGWQSAGRWTFRNNSYTLGSSFAPNNQRPSALALYRYRLVTETTDSQDWFKQKAMEIDGRLVSTDHIEYETFNIDCAYILNDRLGVNVFLGTIRLPHNHQFDIEIHENVGDVVLAEETFARMIKSISFKDNKLLDDGAAIISNVKSEEIRGLISNQKRQSIFLIGDAKKRTIGFEIVVVAVDVTENKSEIKAASMLYLRGPNAQEQIASYKSNGNFDEFTWKSQAFDQDGTSGAELVLDSNGLLTIKKIGFGSVENTCYPGTASIPDILLDPFFVKLLESDQQKAQIDMIKDNGKITPTLITRIENIQDDTTDNNAAYILRLDFLDNGSSEKIYLDRDMGVFERLVQLDEPYLFKKATVEQVTKEFPERAEEILQITQNTNKNAL